MNSKLLLSALLFTIAVVGGLFMREKAREGDQPPYEDGGTTAIESLPEDGGSESAHESSVIEEVQTSTDRSLTSTEIGLPVFPGAIGYGTRTKAGRGGKVIEVTTLEDSPGEGPPGSLRRAILAEGPRIIVFKVGGVIQLKEDLFIREPYITIAGQTAPGDGITLRDFGVQILTHDILVQHLRVRPGNEGDIAGDANDGINFLGKRFGGDVYNVVLDHVSVSWAEDENVSMIGGLRDVTISNSIISEGLNRSRHDKGTHSTGLYFGDISTFSSVGNLLAHNNFRNPVILNNYDKVSMQGELINNVIYNWKDVGTEITNYAEDSGGFINVNIVGNYYRKGPSSVLDWPIVVGQEGFPKIYAKNNAAPEFEALLTPELAAKNNVATGDYLIIGGLSVKVDRSVTDGKIRASQFKTPAVSSAVAPTVAYENVLKGAGATKPKRDAIDTRIVNDVRSKTGKIIDTPAEVGGYPVMMSGDPYVDTDHDGMGDAWEAETKLNPQDAKDGPRDHDGDGYTNVEEFLFSLL